VCEVVELGARVRGGARLRGPGFELNGGKDAFINIKYMIPTYESCVRQ